MGLASSTPEVSVTFVQVTTEVMKERLSFLSVRDSTTTDNTKFLSEAEVDTNLGILGIADRERLSMPLGMIAHNKKLRPDASAHILWLMIDYSYDQTALSKQVIECFIDMKRKHDPMCQSVTISVAKGDNRRIRELILCGFVSTGRTFVDAQGVDTGEYLFEYKL